MNKNKRIKTIGATIGSLLVLASMGMAEDATPGFNNKIPEKIMTPDVVETRIGTLEFFDGMPTAKTVEAAYDNLDFMRGIEVFLNGIPITSIEGFRLGMRDIGVKKLNQIMITDTLLDSNGLFLTGNTDTVYASGFLDLQKYGAVVVEIPPGCGPGTVDDAFFRFVIDMGAPGPDRGKGGKYLILSPDYEGEVPEGYFVARSTSYMNWLILRGFLVDGKPDAASKMFREGLKVYPLSDKDDPKKMEFVDASGKIFNTIHANNYDFYEELANVIEREPISMLEPELRGLFASIGIQKGKKFDPDARMKKILTEAVAVGNATARAIVFRPRLEGTFIYDNSGWYTAFVGGNHEWLKDGGEGGRNLDARTFFFYQATVNTPAMVLKMIGKGSQYAGCVIDSDGNYLDGSKNYTLNIPANVPAKDFWSVVIYDPQTRSELQTSQPFPSKNNKKEGLVENDDGSVDLYFGPEAPAGKEGNWIQTIPEKGWFAYIRLYGPLEAWFDRTWQPGEIEQVMPETTAVTDENYDLAETQVIISDYVSKIAKATGTDGVGVWMHSKECADPKDKTIMRSNFDTVYSWAVFDLSSPVTIVMPETGGRYQTTWVMSEEHYNPFAFVEPGEYTLTEENVGTPYAIIVVRTQANVRDPEDMAAANELQEKLVIKQESKGTYKASNQWDMDEIMAMREKYQKIAKDEKISPDLYFGKKGERTLKQHNCGTAVGWGGLTADQAAYVDYYPTSDQPQTLTLKDVPANAFWSITVYDKGGYVQTETYNINSQFAKESADGTVVIHFGGDENQENYMEIFKDWTFMLRLYLPKENYLDGSWIRPELELVD